MAEHVLALPESKPAEAELIERARQKDGAAIRLIIKQQNRRLYRIARSIVQDDGEAEDALQEAYVRAFNNLHAFRGEPVEHLACPHCHQRSAYLLATPETRHGYRLSSGEGASERSDYFLSAPKSRTRS